MVTRNESSGVQIQRLHLVVHRLLQILSLLVITVVLRDSVVRRHGLMESFFSLQSRAHRSGCGIQVCRVGYPQAVVIVLPAKLEERHGTARPFECDKIVLSRRPLPVKICFERLSASVTNSG
jgi:hypothetical protein